MKTVKNILLMFLTIFYIGKYGINNYYTNLYKFIIYRVLNPPLCYQCKEVRRCAIFAIKESI